MVVSYIYQICHLKSINHADRNFFLDLERSLPPEQFQPFGSFYSLCPARFLSRFIDLGFPYFLYFNLVWLAFTLLLSPFAFAATWVLIRLFFENQPKKCPHCGNITHHATPAIELCEHCEGVLGEWLFVPEGP